MRVPWSGGTGVKLTQAIEMKKDARLAFGVKGSSKATRPGL